MDPVQLQLQQTGVSQVNPWPSRAKKCDLVATALLVSGIVCGVIGGGAYLYNGCHSSPLSDYMFYVAGGALGASALAMLAMGMMIHWARQHDRKAEEDKIAQNRATAMSDCFGSLVVRR